MLVISTFKFNQVSNGPAAEDAEDRGKANSHHRPSRSLWHWQRLPLNCYKGRVAQTGVGDCFYQGSARIDFRNSAASEIYRVKFAAAVKGQSNRAVQETCKRAQVSPRRGEFLNLAVAPIRRVKFAAAVKSQSIRQAQTRCRDRIYQVSIQ